jgi:hypothetical protein
VHIEKGQAMDVAQSPVYQEVFDFLVSSPTPEQILAFRPSESTQERIRALLEANKANRLTAEEQIKLDEFEQVEHFVRMLKIYARQSLNLS